VELADHLDMQRCATSRPPAPVSHSCLSYCRRCSGALTQLP